MSRGETYGHRARIGYTCPPLSAEVFPYEFYKLVPDGVTLVITTLTVIERSTSEVEGGLRDEHAGRARTRCCRRRYRFPRRRAGQSLPRPPKRAGPACNARGGAGRQGVVERRGAGEGG